MSYSRSSIRIRDLIVMGCMGVLLFFWFFPIAALAGLLSYQEIQKTMPWLGELIDRNDKIRAIVQNSLPSVAMITLNALLPFILESRFLRSCLHPIRLITCKVSPIYKAIALAAGLSIHYSKSEHFSYTTTTALTRT
jgi:hypothetical protein